LLFPLQLLSVNSPNRETSCSMCHILTPFSLAYIIYPKNQFKPEELCNISWQNDFFLQWGDVSPHTKTPSWWNTPCRLAAADSIYSQLPFISRGRLLLKQTWERAVRFWQGPHLTWNALWLLRLK
jgi:hypothetical protein